MGLTGVGRGHGGPARRTPGRGVTYTYQAACRACGTSIGPRIGGRGHGQPSRYCSPACRRAWRLEYFRGRPRTPHVPRDPRPRELTCPECGAVFMTTHGRRRLCSDPCSQAARRRYNATRPRDRKRRFPPIHGRRRRELFERDAWSCGICHAPIDPTLRWPHPGSPSIDHVDPLGAHDPSNWQAAHLACNTAKGTKAA